MYYLIIQFGRFYYSFIDLAYFISYFLCSIFETVYALKIMVANKKQHQRFRLTSLMGYAIKDRKKDKGMETERYIE